MREDPFDDLEGDATVKRSGAEGLIAAFSLEVVHGPDRGVSHRIERDDPTPCLVGQSGACTLRLSDPEVSRRHAELSVDGHRLRVRDLGSTNGTYVDDVAVVEAWALGGEHLRFGSTALKVERVTSAARQQRKVDRFGRFLGASPEMLRLYPLVERLAAATIPVVIEGETGTGKEVLAEAMHEASPRRGGPYVVFDCTAVPASLVEAELFGHERGAFTTALATRKGVFEQAHGGTLLIDEIGDLEPALQPKLLRAIERSEVRRIGADRFQQVDVRVVAATRRNLDREVQEGRFRDDLFHRLAVGRIELPPLRRRRGDAELLARHFWRELGGAGSVPPVLLARWVTDPWPGNTRELRNAVARQLAVGDFGQTRDDADAGEAPGSTVAPGQEYIDAVLDEGLALPMARLRVVGELERRYIERVLAAHGGNVARAAEASGIGRRYFQMIRGRVGKK
jgi:two-component system, NtrC family, response regulator HydG